MGVFLRQTSEQLDGAQVGAEVKKILGRNLADHHALSDVVFLKDLHQLVELPNAEPFDDIHELGQFRLGLIREGGGHEVLDAGGAGFAGEHAGQGAVAGDDAERMRSVSHWREFNRRKRMAQKKSPTRFRGGAVKRVWT